ncbi:MAG: hypothetical protein QOF61_3101 [Acidobacteriota bacterium]|nr:hypothetical protein [Acidobacteriota bacterium]
MRRFRFISGALLLTLAAGCARRAEVTPAHVATAETTATAQSIRVSPGDVKAAEPAVAADVAGTTYVAYVEHREDGAADVWLARLARGAQPGAPVRVNPRVGEATAWRGDPPTVAVAPKGTIYVGWTARPQSVPQGSHANDLYVSASSDGGRTFNPPVKVDSDARPSERGLHSLAVAHDGSIHVAWLDGRNAAAAPSHDAMAGGAHQPEANREVFYSFSTDGGQSFARGRLIAREACPCCKTALASGADGEVYLSWRQVLPGDFRHIAVAASKDGGRSFNSPVVVSDDQWKIGGCPVSGAPLAVVADGALRVVWYTAGAAGETGLYWSESRDGGRTFSPRQLLARGKTRGTPGLSADGKGGTLIVWESGEGGAPRLLSARLAGDGRAELLNAAARAGEVPSIATSTPSALAYVVETEGRRGIWLTRAGE